MSKVALPESQNSLRILYVISHYQLGGAEKYVFELAHLLYDHKKLGVVAVLGDDSSIVGRSMTYEAKQNGLAIYYGVRLPWKFGGFLAAALRLRRIIRDFQPDIIHLNTEIPEFTYLLSLLLDKSLKGIPVVRTIHNTDLWRSWARLGAWCEGRLGDAPVVYVSGAVRESFKKWRYECGLANVKIDSTIYNPITVPVLREQIFNSRVKNKEIRLLFAGRFEFQKGFDLLPEILRLVKVPSDVKISLFIYGEGSGGWALSKLRDSPPARWHVQLLPPQPNLVELLHEFDILLFPSRFEGYGRLAAEAVLAGIPVVAFRLPVLSEIFPPNYPWLALFDGGDVSGFAEHVSCLLGALGSTQNILDDARFQLKLKLDPGNIVTEYIKFYENAV